MFRSTGVYEFTGLDYWTGLLELSFHQVLQGDRPNGQDTGTTCLQTQYWNYSWNQITISGQVDLEFTWRENGEPLLLGNHTILVGEAGTSRESTVGGPVVVEPGDKFRLSVEEMMVAMNLSVMKEASKKEEVLPHASILPHSGSMQALWVVLYDSLYRRSYHPPNLNV